MRRLPCWGCRTAPRSSLRSPGLRWRISPMARCTAHQPVGSPSPGNGGAGTGKSAPTGPSSAFPTATPCPAARPAHRSPTSPTGQCTGMCLPARFRWSTSPEPSGAPTGSAVLRPQPWDCPSPVQRTGQVVKAATSSGGASTARLGEPTSSTGSGWPATGSWVDPPRPWACPIAQWSTPGPAVRR